jgi:glycogen synthase
MSLKVLMFGWEFPPHNSGGLGTACYGLTRALVENSVQVSFVLPYSVNVETDWLTVIPAGVKKMHIRGVRALLSPYVSVDEYMKKILFYRGGPYAEDLLAEVHRYALHARDIAAEEQHEVIHSHEWLSFPAGLEARNVSDKPVVMHVHSTEYDRSGGNVNSEVLDLEMNALKQSDRVIAVSDYTRKILVSKYGIKPSSIDVVHNGVHQPGEPDYQDTSDNEVLKLKKMGYKIVLYVGRFSLHKGPDYFLQAAKRVLEYHPKTLFVMAGSGEMEHQLVRQAADLRIAQNVIFAGFLRGSDLARMYASADLYILPSVSEPFGIAPLESLTYGTPVLVSNQSGVAEALKHALKVDFWDVEEMTNKIVTVLSHDSLRSNLGENGHREARKFNWNAAAEKCITIYRSLL